MNKRDTILKADILGGLMTDIIGQNVYIFDEIDSTNNEAKRMAENSAPDGTLIVSDCQSAGRGRRGRSWESPSGCGIFMTLLLRPKMDPAKASMLTLVAAMAVRMAIYKTTGLLTMIKWPNDLVCQGKKVCGILTEMSAEPDAVNYVVVGVGINVNHKEFPEKIREMATSLALECGHDLERNLILSEFCNYFEKYYQRFLVHSDMRELMEEYNAGLINAGRQIRVLDHDGEYGGCSDGINQNGELLVRKDDGETVAIMSGEVSVRGVYGYV